MLKLALAYRNASPGVPASGEPDRARTPSSMASGPWASEASKAVSLEAMPLVWWSRWRTVIAAERLSCNVNQGR
jgi:hypothetical protein